MLPRASVVRSCQLLHGPGGHASCPPLSCSLQSALGLVQDPSSQGDAIRDAFVLLGFLFFFRLLVYIVLRHKTSKR